jgi:hypothetical protein
MEAEAYWKEPRQLSKRQELVLISEGLKDTSKKT